MIHAEKHSLLSMKTFEHEADSISSQAAASAGWLRHSVALHHRLTNTLIYQEIKKYPTEAATECDGGLLPCSAWNALLPWNCRCGVQLSVSQRLLAISRLFQKVLDCSFLDAQTREHDGDGDWRKHTPSGPNNTPLLWLIYMNSSHLFWVLNY